MTFKVAATAFALSLTALGLAACGQGGGDAAPEAAQSGIAVTDGRMVLNAVSGNPAAVYFNLANNTDGPITIRGASVANAESAMLHSYQEWDRKMIMGEMAPLAVPSGGTTTFAPGGQHVMVMGVSPQLKAGGTTEVTLKLLGGGTHSFPVSILAAGSVDETPPPMPTATPTTTPTSTEAAN